jgi:hypothetical protein
MSHYEKKKIKTPSELNFDAAFEEKTVTQDWYEYQSQWLTAIQTNTLLIDVLAKIIRDYFQVVPFVLRLSTTHRTTKYFWLTNFTLVYERSFELLSVKCGMDMSDCYYYREPVVDLLLNSFAQNKVVYYDRLRPLLPIIKDKQNDFIIFQEQFYRNKDGKRLRGQFLSFTGQDVTINILKSISNIVDCKPHDRFYESVQRMYEEGTLEEISKRQKNPNVWLEDCKYYIFQDKITRFFRITRSLYDFDTIFDRRSIKEFMTPLSHLDKGCSTKNIIFTQSYVDS